jgi:hypothetical protein
MSLKGQRGELSLLWVAVSMAALAFVAMAGIFWMRYERNLFAEIWRGALQTLAAKAVQQTQSTPAGSVKSAAGIESAAIRKCTVDGKVTYSNVECNAKDPTSRAVKLHDSSGFDAPKAPPAGTEQDVQADVRQKMIDRAVAR